MIQLKKRDFLVTEIASAFSGYIAKRNRHTIWTKLMCESHARRAIWDYDVVLQLHEGYIISIFKDYTLTYVLGRIFDSEFIDWGDHLKFIVLATKPITPLLKVADGLASIIYIWT
jgi:hypothetical protein